MTGNIVGGGDVSVSGLAITADIIGSSVAPAGKTIGATEGLSTASLSQPGARVADEPSATSIGNGSEDEEKKIRASRSGWCEEQASSRHGNNFSLSRGRGLPAFVAGPEWAATASGRCSGSWGGPR